MSIGRYGVGCPAQAIEPGDRAQNTITVRARSMDKDRICIEVQDTGPGISPQMLAKPSSAPPVR